MADKKTLLELLVNSSDGLDSLSVKELDWMAEYVGVPDSKLAATGGTKAGVLALLQEHLGEEGDGDEAAASRGHGTQSVRRKIRAKIKSMHVESEDPSGPPPPVPAPRRPGGGSKDERHAPLPPRPPQPVPRDRTYTTDSLASEAGPALPPRNERAVLGSFKTKTAASSSEFIPEVENPAARPTPSLPPAKPQPPQTGVKTGNLELSKDQLANLMNEMLKDINGPGAAKPEPDGFGRGPSVKATGPATIESAMAKVEMREKLPSFIRNKDAFEMEVDNSYRATMLVEDYVATEDDLASQVVHESEIGVLEEVADALNLDEDADVIPMTEPILHVAAQVTYVEPEGPALPSTPSYRLALSCGEVPWEVTRTREDFAQFLVDLSKHHEFAEVGSSFPAAPPPATRGSVKQKDALASAAFVNRELASDYELWLNGVLSSVPHQTVIDVGAFDDFLDCFWYLKEAKKNSPPVINYLAHRGKTRQEAEFTLKSKPPGTYLIRDKTGEAGQLVISTIHEEGYWHGVVVVDPTRPSYTLLGSDLAHPKLEQLLEFYQKHPYSKNEGKLWTLGSFCGVPRNKPQ